MKPPPLFFLGVILALPASASDTVPDKVTPPTVPASITPTRIAEDRESDLAKADVEMVGSHQLKLTVRVEGEGFQETRAWGNVLVTEATDDAGHDLRVAKKPKAKPRKPPADPDGDDADAGDSNESFTLIEPREGSDPQELLVDINLSLAPRAATHIAKLRGEFTVVRGGEIKEVAIDHLLDLVGKQPVDAVLKEAGVEIMILRGDKPDDKKATASDQSFVKVRIKKNPLAVLKLDVFDEKGNSAVASSTYGLPSADEADVDHDFGLKAPLDNTMVLKVHVTVGAQKVQVPFDLKGVELP